MDRYTKQGIRNLDHLPSPKKQRISMRGYGPLRQCSHRHMQVDCYLDRWHMGFPPGTPYGHISCPDCGLFLHSFDC